MKKTKIVCTLGPASQEVNHLVNMINAGRSIFVETLDPPIMAVNGLSVSDITFSTAFTSFCIR